MAVGYSHGQKICKQGAYIVTIQLQSAVAELLPHRPSDLLVVLYYNRLSSPNISFYYYSSSSIITVLVL